MIRTMFGFFVSENCFRDLLQDGNVGYKTGNSYKGAVDFSGGR